MRILIIMILLQSCALVETKTRSARYIDCITELTREGVRQDRIKELCDASIDGNY